MRLLKDAEFAVTLHPSVMTVKDSQLTPFSAMQLRIADDNGRKLTAL
jgi:hypothetical protein